MTREAQGVMEGFGSAADAPSDEFRKCSGQKEIRTFLCVYAA